jgi:hypothetical protein
MAALGELGTAYPIECNYENTHLTTAIVSVVTFCLGR